MPPKASSGCLISLSASESTLFYAVIKHTITLEVDWSKVAADAGYKNEANAKTMYKRFKVKIENRTSTASPTGSAKRKNDETEETSIPKKRAKAAPKAKKAKKDESDGEDTEASVKYEPEPETESEQEKIQTTH